MDGKTNSQAKTGITLKRIPIRESLPNIQLSSSSTKIVPNMACQRYFTTSVSPNPEIYLTTKSDDIQFYRYGGSTKIYILISENTYQNSSDTEYNTYVSFSQNMQTLLSNTIGTSFYLEDGEYSVGIGPIKNTMSSSRTVYYYSETKSELEIEFKVQNNVPTLTKCDIQPCVGDHSYYFIIPQTLKKL